MPWHLHMYALVSSRFCPDVYKAYGHTLLQAFNHHNHHVDGLVQERRNSNALAMELRLSWTNLFTYALVDSRICIGVSPGIPKDMKMRYRYISGVDTILLQPVLSLSIYMVNIEQ